MNGKRAREIRERARTLASFRGSKLRDTEYNINGEVVTKDELRQIKKEYLRNKRNGSHLEREGNMEHR